VTRPQETGKKPCVTKQHVRRRFDATPSAVGEARRFLSEVIAGGARSDDGHELALALSELATNAVLHAQTPFDVVVKTDSVLVRLEVEDGSTDLPVPQPPSNTAESGRGLLIVDSVCDRWGTHIVRDRKCVWCERDL
jgi:anti-sigma regulatory factor (Ser/Thr protein kinase)